MVAGLWELVRYCKYNLTSRLQEGIESQAIDRCNRWDSAMTAYFSADFVSSIGQKKNVHVYQLIAENTVESKV
jgi:SWI/SNF-related matrix-associated actin-dependent regulator of chromatin subfamily A3